MKNKPIKIKSSSLSESIKEFKKRAETVKPIAQEEIDTIEDLIEQLKQTQGPGDSLFVVGFPVDNKKAKINNKQEKVK